ncbi:MAG TPA: oligopeptide transporter, OPT family [Blastocatellia bacterium]|nr:oligopeptide transporter, OPT family [Blastocatellia bacterium]
MSTETIDAKAADLVAEEHENPYLAAFRPYIPAGVRLREFTAMPIIVGTVLGMVFGASSLYLVLKTGLTVSASIPVAVISITLFRALSKIKGANKQLKNVLIGLTLVVGLSAAYSLLKFGAASPISLGGVAIVIAVLIWIILKGANNATILENNIVQTAGSAGESIAFGVGVTMPAILILGFDLEITRVTLVAVLGGLLGILMMIPLRRALIVNQHGYLKYPEGTACAEVLKAGADEESRAAAQTGSDKPLAEVRGLPIFTGLGLGFAYKVAMDAFHTWKDTPEKIFGAPFKAGSIAAEINPALLGVGYIIGPRIASIMCAGGVLAYLVLIPLVKFFGEGMTAVLPPGTKPIGEMSPGDIRSAYVLYIGAGAVAAGGIISLMRSLPTIWHGLKGGIKDFRGGSAAANGAPRTDRDMSMKVVAGGIIVLLAMIMIFPQLHLQWNLLGALLIVAFGFLFVTVSSRLTGEIGSSSNPISGMTVATLLLACLVFLIVGWDQPAYYVTALSIGGIVCIAASNGGTTSQDLKTGFLVGSTPRHQQTAILIGALASALILGPILLRMNDDGTVYLPVANDASLAFPADFRVAPSDLQKEGDNPKTEKLHGPQGASDTGSYNVWFKSDSEGGNAVKYLVDSNGVPVYLADPAINGTHKTRPDGSSVQKYDAPKAVLMSYIIKGILSHKLPWGLVLLGAMISIVLEMSGIPSLAFAVGVYLPLSSSSPIFIGGLIRWLVDKYVHKKFKGQNLTEEQLNAEGDKSQGVLMASGYIAGAALAGIIIAFLQGLPQLSEFNRSIEEWARAHNPFFASPNANLLSLIPFIVMCVLLYMAGRELILAGRNRRSKT